MDGAEEISYTFAFWAMPADSAAAARLAAGRRTLLAATGLYMFTLAAAVVLIAQADWPGILLGSGLLGSTAYDLLWTWLPKPRRNAQPVWLDYNFGGYGLVGRTQDVTTYVRWHAIKELRNGRGLLVFLGRRGVIAYLPETVFASPEEETGFLGFARAQIELGQKALTSPGADAPTV